jgi:ubiquinone/menaquinone biosynthesis C-methylase UbiE
LDIRAYNREAWNREVDQGNQWTIPVDSQTVALARQETWSVLLTPTRPVPASWFPHMRGTKILCLASGGGQQGPTFAAAGGIVTVLDNSPHQLQQDRLVAERENLELELVEGDMADLFEFKDDQFDLIFHPVSNAFVPDVKPVWREAFRVLRREGALLAGFVNPVHYLFDYDLMDEKGELEVLYSIPYSDLKSLPPDKYKHYLESGEPLEFGHTLEDQIGGLIEAGFLISGFYEDIDPSSLIGQYIPSFIAVKAIKPVTAGI